MDRAHERFKNAPIEQTKGVLHNPGELPEARRYALKVLLTRRQAAEMTEALLRLFDDPMPDLWQSAIKSYCLPESLRPHVPPGAWIDPDPRVLERLRGMLDEPRGRSWSEAACALARVRDEAILPKALEWLDRGDEFHRNVALECLVQIGHADALRHLVDAWEAGGRNEGDRLVLAVALLRLRDRRGWPHLVEAARRADSAWSVMSTTHIATSDPALGLGLMLHILDHGSLEAKQAMVSQIWNFAHFPHAFTADGIHEARLWVEERLRQPGGPTLLDRPPTLRSATA
jgi:HEAT repeat protein